MNVTEESVLITSLLYLLLMLLEDELELVDGEDELEPVDEYLCL